MEFWRGTTQIPAKTVYYDATPDYLGSRRTAHSGEVELLSWQGSQCDLLLPTGARTEMMVFLWEEKGRAMYGSAGRSGWFGSLGKEWTKSAPGLEPTMI